MFVAWCWGGIGEALVNETRYEWMSGCGDERMSRKADEFMKLCITNLQLNH